MVQTINSRDIIERTEKTESEVENIVEEIADLQTQLEELEERLDETEDFDNREEIKNKMSVLQSALEDVYSDLAVMKEELDELLAVCEEGESISSDWEYGETLILEDDFEEYAQELADDIGAINRKASWPINHIDWEAAADELKLGYSEIEYDGETYLIRCT